MIKKVIAAEIKENREIIENIFSMTIKAPQISESFCPGQFINVYLEDKSMLLPRPISISSVADNEVTLIYKIVGKGTKQMASYQKGGLVKVSTNLGKGFRMDEALDELKGTSKVIALVGGGMGVAPLVGLVRTLAKEKKVRGSNYEAIKMIAVVGFQNEPILLKELEECCNHVYFATENGTKGFKGNVIQLIERDNISIDYSMACGPKPMLKALAQRCENAGIPLQVSLEERMGCGYGACVGCVCQTKEKETSRMKLKKVCTDGPVFFGSEVIWDE